MAWTKRLVFLERAWALWLRFLPPGWQDAAWTQGAIIRLRAMAAAEALLHLMLAMRGMIGRYGPPRDPVAPARAMDLGTGRWDELALTDAHGPNADAAPRATG